MGPETWSEDGKVGDLVLLGTGTLGDPVATDSASVVLMELITSWAFALENALGGEVEGLASNVKRHIYTYYTSLIFSKLKAKQKWRSFILFFKYIFYSMFL